MYGRSRPRVGEQVNIPPHAAPFRPQQTSLTRTQASQPPRPRTEGRGATEQVIEVEGVYIISVAARILDMHPQTLRKYEKLGLISPGRTMGLLRLYSPEDIQKLRLIRHLVGNLGFNLAGVEFTLSLVDNLLHLRERLAAALEDSPLQSVIDQEIALLFQNLDLPLVD